MPEGSDSADRPAGPSRHRPPPFDQDDADDLGEPGEPAEEPDFEAFLAESRLEQQSAGAADAEANRRAFTALADADRETDDDIGAFEARPPAVVVVATRGGATLERCLAALADQDYPALTVLALDGSPDAEPLSARVAAVAPRALVRRVDTADQGVGPAVPALGNDVIESVQGATFFVFVADNVVLDRSAVRLLVDEAVTSNAGLAAPKLVSDTARDELVDVGWLVDRYGDAWSVAEPGERDQEQHDAVRDVFFVSARAMLVRGDLFAALEGFDAVAGPAAARDLAWRARLAGARVVVVPDARGVVVPEARRVTTDDVRALTRGRLRAIYKTGSRWTLALTLPLALLFIVVDALVHLVRGRRAYSGAVVSGALDGLRDVTELRAERRMIQSTRVVPDADLRPYMVRGSARVRRVMTRRFHVDERIAGASLRTREFLGEGESSWRNREGLLLGALVLVSLVATRSFVSGGTPSFGELLSWPHASTLFHDFAAGHRTAYFGSNVAAPPLLAVCGVLVALFVGHADLARTALVTLAIPIGIIGVYAMLRRSTARAWPALAAATAYAANPVSRNAIARGEVGVIALFALAPLLWMMVVGRPPAADATDGAGSGAVAVPARTREQRIGHVMRLALLTAIAIAWWPPAVLLPVLLAAADFAAGVLTDDRRPTDVVVDAAYATGVAVLLLLPWSLAFFAGDGARIGFQARSAVTVQQLVSVNAGPNGAGWLGLGLLAAAVLPLLIATGERLRRAVAAWLLVALAVVVPIVAQHVGKRAALPEIDALLVVAGLAIAVAVGVGVAAFLAEIRTFIFGARQLVAVGCLVVLVTPFAGWLGDVTDGHVHAPHAQWNDQLSWMRAEAARDGDFRVLWLGPASSLPGGSVWSHGVDLAVTDNGVGDVRASLPATGEPVRLTGESLALATAQQTARFGRLVAPMAVRYVAVVDRAAPDAQPRPVDRRLVRALDAQLDLELYDTENGLRLYRNDAWAPRVAVLPPGVDVPNGRAASRDPIGAALATDLSGGHKLRPQSPTGTLFLSDHAAAEATLDGRTLPGGRAFGWAHMWPLGTRGTVTVGPPGSLSSGALLTLAVIGWFVVVVFAFRPTGFGRRRPRHAAARPARPPASAGARRA